MQGISRIASLGVLAALLSVCSSESNTKPPPTCFDGLQNVKETDIDCGGSDCAPCEVDRSCAVATDCASAVCRDSTCRTPTCFNGTQDLTETDVDCGGGECAACVVNKKCRAGSDCVSGQCLDGTCQSPSCANARIDGSETDVDCGGGCAKCGDGKSCKGAADCTSGSCVGNRCAAPSCSDAIKNGVETDVDCGGSCGACALGRVCATNSDCGPWTCDAGRCGLGTGTDGPLTVAAGTNLAVNSTSTAATGTLGSTTLNLVTPTGFATGQAVFIHQTQGSGAGQHEVNRIVSVAGTTATLARPLIRDYVGGAQAVVMPQYTTVRVSAGGQLYSPAYNGNSGGILAFLATGQVVIDGTVTMFGQGFRGGGFNVSCFPGSPGCIINNGISAESEAGGQFFASVLGNGLGANNGSSGGGGTRGQDCAAGGGGSHATSGTAGTNGANAICTSSPIHGGGAPGTLIGTPDLSQAIFFGGAGGEGGPDEDGTHPGPGGSGGGIMVLFAGSLIVNDQTGVIDASGGSGGFGINAFLGCGGSGAGMGNGGGGAGGAIRIFTAGTTSLGTARITALGGFGSAQGACGGRPGGNGGIGRIHVRAGGYQTGLTNPLAYSQ